MLLPSPRPAARGHARRASRSSRLSLLLIAFSMLLLIGCNTSPLVAPTPTAVPTPQDFTTVGTVTSMVTSFVLHEGTMGHDGNLWFTSQGAIHRMTPQGSVKSFPLSTNEFADAITTGPDQALWFISRRLPDQRDEKDIGRMTIQGAITHYSLPSTCSDADSITSGPDGSLWFTCADEGKVGRITPHGTITLFSLPQQNNTFCAPQRITAGPDGNLWFTARIVTQSSNHRLLGAIGRITPQGGTRLFSIPGDDPDPQGIVTGPDGNLWFAEQINKNGGVGRITPQGMITQITIPYEMIASSRSMVTGPDGNIWLIGMVSGLLMRVTPQEKVTAAFTYKGRLESGNLWQLIAGPGKTLWAWDSIEGHTLVRFALRIP